MNECVVLVYFYFFIQIMSPIAKTSRKRKSKVEVVNVDKDEETDVLHGESSPVETSVRFPCPEMQNNFANFTIKFVYLKIDIFFFILGCS